MSHTPRKQPYTVPCSSEFRDRVTDLAARRRVNVADLARSVLIVLPFEAIRNAPDPGGPPPGDREETVLKSGPSKGKPWRRKPRLQMRLSAGYDPSFVRRALGIALAMDSGDLELSLEDPNAEPGAPVAAESELERLKATVSALSFSPLRDGVRSRADALHILGFPPAERPDRSMVTARFRMLATIHHPDGELGSHQRMSQLNAAREILSA